jgi:hypothetical protein
MKFSFCLHISKNKKVKMIKVLVIRGLRQFIQIYQLRFDWIRTLIKETGKIEEDDFRREIENKLGLGLFPNLQSTLPLPIIENYNIVNTPTHCISNRLMLYFGFS